MSRTLHEFIFLLNLGRIRADRSWPVNEPKQAYRATILSEIVFHLFCVTVIRRGDAGIEDQTSKRGMFIKAETLA